MRARWLKPEFFTDKKIAAMGPIVALVYQALWCMADDGGTARSDADFVKAQMFYRWSAVGVPEITGALQLLAESQRIRTYSVGDDEYAIILRWKEHQQVHKPGKFRHPKEPKALTAKGAETVPHSPGEGAESVGESPPSRHLDSKTPRQLEGPPGVVPDEPWPEDADAAWDSVVRLVPAFQRREWTAERHADLPAPVKRALSKVGGFPGIMGTPSDKLVWLKKDFIKAYNA